MSAYYIALVIAAVFAVMAGIGWVHEQNEIRRKARQIHAPTVAELEAARDVTEFFDVPDGTRLMVFDEFSGVAKARRRRQRFVVTAAMWVLLIVALLAVWPS